MESPENALTDNLNPENKQGLVKSGLTQAVYGSKQEDDPKSTLKLP